MNSYERIYIILTEAGGTPPRILLPSEQAAKVKSKEFGRRMAKRISRYSPKTGKGSRSRITSPFEAQRHAASSDPMGDPEAESVARAAREHLKTAAQQGPRPAWRDYLRYQRT